MVASAVSFRVIIVGKNCKHLGSPSAITM
jgi:hypothetical protein